MKKFVMPLVCALAGSLGIGCSSARDIQVTGEVQGGLAGQNVQVEFWDINGSDQTKVHSVTLLGAGAFDETVPLEGDKLIVRAIVDADADGLCSAGELWTEVSASIPEEEDTLKLAALTVGSAPCDASQITSD
ncbi:MAG: hypothetical protein R3B13_29595 [Polyangiaceae bacterium]